MSNYTGNRVFAPAIFFIAFRESLEASLVIGVLTGMLEKVVDVKRTTGGGPDLSGQKLIRKLRRYIFAGASLGLLIAFAIGAAFLAVFYTQTTDLYGRSEELWEGIFNLIAVCLITPMSLAILRADRSRAKWRKKLSNAFQSLHTGKGELSHAAHAHFHQDPATSAHDNDVAVTGLRSMQLPSKGNKNTIESSPPVLNRGTHTSPSRAHVIMDTIKRPFKSEARGVTAVFIIPFITTLREGLEGVVFIGGVSLGLPATSIPLPAILGIFIGLLCGFVVFKAGSFSKIRIFLVISTCILLVIAAGMASRSIYYFQFYKYVRLVGDAAAESGSGPGSYNSLDYVWHIDCCNPEDKTNGGSGYAIMNSLVGWNNTATIGSILSYIFYWLAIISYLSYSHLTEKRKGFQFAQPTHSDNVQARNDDVKEK